MPSRNFSSHAVPAFKSCCYPTAPNGAKVGLDDYFVAGHTVAELLQLTGTPPAADESKKVSAAKALYELVMARDVELSIDPNAIAYITFARRDHWETVNIQSPELTSYLNYLAYHEMDGKLLPSTTYADVVARLYSEATNNPATVRRTFDLRYARVGDEALYVDLCRPDWQIVEITAAGWRLMAYDLNCPVRFHRSPSMAPLPIPEHVDDPVATFAEMCGYFNIPHDNRPLFGGYLVGIMRRAKEFPITIFRGAEDTGKTTRARFISWAVDPTSDDVGALTGRPEDFDAAIANCHAQVFDNASYLDQTMSDRMCRASTGMAMVKRKLYTEFGQARVKVTVAISITSITDLTYYPDLVSRLIAFDSLQITTPKKRGPVKSSGARVKSWRPTTWRRCRAF